MTSWKVDELRRLIGPGRTFLRWWLGELAGMIPAPVRERLARTGEVPVLLYTHAQTLDWMDGVPKPRRRRKQRARIRLPADRALRTRVTLPFAVEENLAEVVRFELDRRTPFSADQVYLAHRISARNEAAAQLQVELTVVPRAVADEAMAAATRLGVTPVSLDVDAAAPGEPVSDNLLPDGRSRRHGGRRFGARRGLIGLAALAAIAAAYVPILHGEHEVAQLRAELDTAKAAARQAAQAQDAVEGLAADARFLAQRKRAAVTTTELLYEVTRILPDDTWLDQLGVADGKVQMAGYSPSSSALIGLIGRSRLLAEPKFRAAVTRDAATGRERFEISAKIARRGDS